MEQPLVSVLMTAYNREKYIREAIESVLASTYTNFELIIVDDCSMDRTVSIAREYEIKDQRIKVYINEKNLGDYPNRNKAATYARGKYIKYVDSDDRLYDYSLDYCVSMMEKNPAADWGLLNRNISNDGKVFSPHQTLHKHFFAEPSLTIGPGGSILKHDFFKSLGYYPVTYGPANDMFFNLVAAANGNLLFLHKEFLFYRLHEGQEFNNKTAYLSNNYIYLKDALPLLTNFFNKKQIAFIRKKNKRRFISNIFHYVFSTGNLKQAYSAIKKTRFSIKDAFEGIFH
jgi:glycosyltransferase involved in cell wall biosynthesis